MLNPLMQDHPLLISGLLTHAERHHGDAEIVSRQAEGDLHRSSWRDVALRSRRIANALASAGVPAGGRVGTLAWNGYRHLELYFGVSGSGRVLHTINPRLHPDQVAWIVNHAEDDILCFDLSFLPLVQAIHPRCGHVRRFVALCGPDQVPADSGIPNLVSYEEWLARECAGFDWPRLEENSASGMCYTSGTTGRPKAVVYSHRSTVLHAYAAALPDSMGLSARDSVMPVVPMFHVNAWGIPYAAALVGCKLVLPGAALDGRSVYELIEGEQVTFAAGVPTVWQMLLDHTRDGRKRFTTLGRTVIGGSACPPAMIDCFRDQHGVEVIHGWGMTESSPLGATCTLKRKHLAQHTSDQAKVLAKQGRALPGIDFRVVGEDGRELPWDGTSCGDLHIRGPWVLRDYYRSGEPAPLVDGWFPTGDVARIDADGYLQITDRSKDVIKSGGEWISSIDLENIAMSHPAVQMAACIAVPHPKWNERPLLAVVKRPDAPLSAEDVKGFFEGKVARWQVPDQVVFVQSIPVGPTGKMLKTKLREMLA